MNTWIGIYRNQELINHLNRSVTRKFKRRKVYSYYQDNIWNIDLANKKIINLFNKGVKLLFCAFDSVLDEFHCKPNKIWVDDISEFCNLWSHDCIAMTLKRIHHAKKENLLFLRDCQNHKEQRLKGYNGSNKNMHIHWLDEIVDKCNNTCPRTIEISPSVQPSTYTEYGVQCKILNSK